MKLTAIMLIINSFFANQQGVDVVGNFFQPIKEISTDSPLSGSEFQNEKDAIISAAEFCREQNLIEQLDSALMELYGFYEDIDSFEAKMRDVHEKTELDVAQVSLAINLMLSSMKNDVISKLADFDSEVLKRGNDLELLNDSQLLRQVANKSSRFFSELKTLVAQVTTTDVELSTSFLSESEIQALLHSSQNHFRALSA